MRFRHPTDEQLRYVDISFLATKKICSLSTLNCTNLFDEKEKNKSKVFPARFELATFRVLGGRDNHYTTETTVHGKE